VLACNNWSRLRFLRFLWLLRLFDLLLVVLAFNFLDLWFDVCILGLHIIVETAFGEDVSENLLLFFFELLQGVGNDSKLLLCLYILRFEFN
jgi:hypothetical protein